MGVPTCRFVDQAHEVFVCSVCLDVATDPILVNGCEHVFCRSCIEQVLVPKCPLCQQDFKNPKYQELNGLSKRCYLDLKVTCLNTGCAYVSDVTGYQDHDLVCPIKFEFCSDCGHKSEIASGSVHSCIAVLKDHYERKLVQVETKFKSQLDKVNGDMDKIKGNMDKMNGDMDEMNGDMAKFVDSVNYGIANISIRADVIRGEIKSVDGRVKSTEGQIKSINDRIKSSGGRVKSAVRRIEGMIIAERKRTEDLVAVSLSNADTSNSGHKHDGAQWNSEWWPNI